MKSKLFAPVAVLLLTGIVGCSEPLSMIADKKGAEIVSVVTDGPLFFIQLPPGAYTVSATFRNETKEIRALTVGKDGFVRRTLAWDLGEQSPNV